MRLNYEWEKTLIVSPHGDDAILGATEFITTDCDYRPTNVLIIADKYSDQKLDTLPLIDITRRIEEKIQEMVSDKSQLLILIPPHEDRNEDHRVVHRACLPAVRPYRHLYISTILEYSIIGSTMSEWRPNYFMNISKADIDLKEKLMLKNYPKEMGYPRDRKSLETFYRYWGLEVTPDYEFYEFVVPYKILFMKG